MVDPRHPCGGDDALATELAVSLATGRERAMGLEHLRACRPCRTRVAELSEVVELLQLAAAEAEPPAGFESGVLRRLTPSAPAPRYRRRVLTTMAAALVLLVAIGIGRWSADTTESLAEATMVTPAGANVGSAWRYDGAPSWLFVSIPAWRNKRTGVHPSNYRLQITLDDGRTIDLGVVDLLERNGSWGTDLVVDAEDVQAVSILGDSGLLWCTGRFTS